MVILIAVRRIEETIKAVSSHGITYLNAQGQQILIELEECHRNYLNSLKDEKLIEIAKMSQTVGQRDILADPPFIELFTVPLTRFEFARIDDCHEFRHRIRKARWHTRDLT